ncbi:MAG: uracil-DNA glycosylase, partial [Actinomycetota bacterium]|nr:uracil-DNA glycosylase [Actinomycetota bacterium]
RPFVGPAGRELDRVLEAAGIDRGETYVTNVVKRFKFVEKGKRRLHDKPNRNEVKACRPWLDRELALIGPEAVVALGATAAQSLFGSDFRVTRMHGRPVESFLSPLAMATIHPSAILRSRTPESRAENRELMIADLAKLAGMLDGR